MQGLLLVDKPAGWTSFDVVNYVRQIARQAAVVESYQVRKAKSEKAEITLDWETFKLSTRLPKVKVGHTGTLDPFATGLLVLLIGKDYTKRAGELSKLNKTYEVTMRLGKTSTTGDPEGEITDFISHAELAPRHLDQSGEIYSKSEQISRQARDDIVIPTRDEVEKATKQFKGAIQQVPPAYSAIKIDGQRAYKLAREGKQVVIEPRTVSINSLQINDYNYPEVKFTVDVSSGTYIRTLVEDIGKILNTGAYTVELRRIRVGKYLIDEAIGTDKLDADMIAKNLQTSLQ